MARNLNLFLRAGNGFLETEGEIVAKIFSPGVTTTATRRHQELTENIAENIFESPGEIESAARKWTTITECRMTELVVLGALL